MSASFVYHGRSDTIERALLTDLSLTASSQPFVAVPATIAYHKNYDAIERALPTYILTSRETGQLYAVVSAVLTYRKALSPGEIHTYDVAAFLIP
jgi:hypothetical protein